MWRILTRLFGIPAKIMKGTTSILGLQRITLSPVPEADDTDLDQQIRERRQREDRLLTELRDTFDRAGESLERSVRNMKRPL